MAGEDNIADPVIETQNLVIEVMDSTNPLYMHPSENAGSSLVPMPFDGIGYRSWRRGVLRALSWERCDDMVTSWILNSLSKDIADSLQYVNDSKELWQEFEDGYDQTNRAKMYQLQKEINDLTQGSLDVTGYYTKMKKLWEELHTLNANTQCNCQCICGAKANMYKEEQDRRLIQFLMGLNEVYTVIRGSILMMNPLPTIAQVFSILIQEEKQREVRPHRYRGPRLFCDYCKRPGHTKDKCYKLHGFPQNFKFTKGRNVASAANVHGGLQKFPTGEHDLAESNGQNQHQTQIAPNLTKDQYNQLLSLLEKLHIGTVAETTNNITNGAVNFAGILVCCTYDEIIGDLSYKCSHLPANFWILDSGASNHMSYNKNLFTNTRVLPYPFLVTLPNGYRVKVTEIGDAPSMKIPLEIGRARNGLYFFCSECQSANLASFFSYGQTSLHHSVTGSPISADAITDSSPQDLFIVHTHEQQTTTNLDTATNVMPNSSTNSPIILPEPRKSSKVMGNISHESEPCSYEEATMNPAWQAAMTQEFEALYVNHTWDLLVLPTGIDYTETFSPVVKMTTVRTLISVAVKKGWDLFQLDVNKAFLHGDLHEEASRQWYDKLTESLCSRGFVHSVNDYTLFYKKNAISSIFVVVYVDDFILTGTNLSEITALKNFLHDKFKIKDLGKLHYFLGLEIFYRTDGVLISQRKFATNLLKEYDCLGYTTVTSPLDCTVKLKATEGPLLADPTFYRKLMGKLNFLTNTRLDITYSVQHLSQFMQSPREPHLKAALHVLRYLKVDPTLGIFLSNSPDYTLRAYYDSDWAACPDSRRSVSGYVVLFGESAISWKSKKQDTVSLSSAEA
ncbi:uncharacterized protein [Nicotiana sylvestris]|uniref:uncharacterized protein n=1 Tax=Nicotiana sylvestris TaxID=4096 RepID=UPI00388C3939